MPVVKYTVEVAFARNRPPDVGLSTPPPVNVRFAPALTVTPPYEFTTRGPENTDTDVTNTVPPLTISDAGMTAFGPARLSCPLVICTCTPAVVLNAALDATEQFEITIEPFVPDTTDAESMEKLPPAKFNWPWLDTDTAAEVQLPPPLRDRPPLTTLTAPDATTLNGTLIVLIEYDPPVKQTSC